MSSTSRGGKRSPADFYATPPWPVHRLLERVQFPGGLWLEPAAGDGAIIKAVNQKRNDIAWEAVELREECRSKLKPLARTKIGSYLECPVPSAYERRIGEQLVPIVSISNYPFSLAMEFIEHGLRMQIPYVISLLRLNFLGTEDRNDFFQSNMPDVYVIPDRVSFAISVTCLKKTCDWGEIFPLGSDWPRKCPVCGSKTGKSTTDSIEYAWFLWGPDSRGSRRGGRIEVLNATPLEERNLLIKP